jgi:AcrR family transcriptional regulator
MTTCILTLMESRQDRPPTKRRRDPEASRAAILEAAREVFTERGYARATIREIARRAGITHGLVMRHFGTKEQLLIAALPGPRAAAGAVPGDLATLPERIAAAFVAETESAGDGEHVMVALIRSAASGEEVAMPLYAAVEREVTATFREVLGPGSEVYAGLLGSLLIGVTFGRRVARTGVLAELTREELIGYLVPAIRALLAPAIAAAEGGRPPGNTFARAGTRQERTVG